MANSHTKVQREWIVTRIAWGYSAALVCEKFRIRFPDTRCDMNDVHSCDPSVAQLGPEEYAVFTKAVDFAVTNPEIIAPALNPVRRQMNLILMAEHERGRGAHEAAAKYYEQVAKEQGGAYAPKTAKGVKDAGASTGTASDSSITWKVIRPEDVV